MSEWINDAEECPGTWTLADGYVVNCEASRGHPKFHVSEVTYRWTDDMAQPAALAAAEARGRQQMIDALRDDVAYAAWRSTLPPYEIIPMLLMPHERAAAADYLDFIAKEGSRDGE